MQSNTIHLVLGISSSGKSSYIEHKKNTKEWDDIPILMGYEIKDTESNDILQQECIIHYNLFRPYDNDAQNIERNFLVEKTLVNLLKYRERIKAYLLITHPAVLSKRILLRTAIEPNLRNTTSAYPSTKIFELLCRLDMLEFHKKWMLLLKEFGIDFEIINSETHEYARITSEDDLSTYFLGEKNVAYTDDEINKIIETNNFEYQKITLPNNQFTKGQDRAPSLMVMDDDLTGKSLLDVGCAYGYFCFEAEKRNAARVVGTELKRHRYIGANIIKQITGAKSEILYQNIFEEPLNETFDIILFLNVIHHLKEPIKALRMIASICTEKLIIEFPTLTDKIFNATLPKPVTFDSSLPLIGVSLQTGYDQTFLFSEQALERILMEHDKLFSKIEFSQSRMNKDRSVAICYK